MISSRPVHETFTTIEGQLETWTWRPQSETMTRMEYMDAEEKWQCYSSRKVYLFSGRGYHWSYETTSMCRRDMTDLIWRCGRYMMICAVP